MSRLFGIVAAKNIRVRFGLGSLTKQSELLKQINPDGWGLGWVGSAGSGVEKRALPVKGSPGVEEHWLEGEGTRFIGHIRRGTRGGRSQRNCHPFLYGGWIFAHSGHLFPKLEAAVRKRLGHVELGSETDSEALFRWLLKSFEPGQPAEQWLRQALKPLVDDGEFSSLNFILASDTAFYAFRLCTRSAAFYSLYHRDWTKGTPLAGDSQETYTRLESKGLAESEAILVCSERLLEGEWAALEQGELLTVTGDLEVQTFKLF